MPADEADRLLVARIRRGDKDAWAECIARFEGRLLAFADSRLKNRSTSEDVVQETFLGFLLGLPNYDDQTPLEVFLFSICAHKLTDVLRRQGRRPAMPLFPGDADDSSGEPQGNARRASSLVRSRERRTLEERALKEALTALVEGWLERGEFERLKCIELLFVLGWPNKDAAMQLGISEQAVANHKHFVVEKLQKLCQQRLA
jgi:RNA polymerase sigma-70 factor (ECF subfamily)